MEDTQTPVPDAPAANNAVDTAEVQTSEANLQEVQTPEASQSTEDNNAQTVNAEDTVSEKLYAGKYKSVEDMEKAYTELQSKYTNTSQERAELSRMLIEAFSAPEPATQNTEDDYDEPTYDAPKSNDDPVQRDLSVMKFMIMHQDADAETLRDVLSTDPLIQNIQGYDAKLEYAYMKSQSLLRDKQIAEAARNATVQATQKTVEKQAAQVETAARSEQVSPADERIARMRAGDQNAIAEAINDLPAVQEMKRQMGIV